MQRGEMKKGWDGKGRFGGGDVLCRKGGMEWNRWVGRVYYSTHSMSMYSVVPSATGQPSTFLPQRRGERLARGATSH